MRHVGENRAGEAWHGRLLTEKRRKLKGSVPIQFSYSILFNYEVPLIACVVERAIDTASVWR